MVAARRGGGGSCNEANLGCPASAGIREDNAALRRLLWVRARSEQEAVRSCERILQTEGFELMLLDLAPIPGQARQRPSDPAREPGPRARTNAISDASWLRLARLAARQRSALVVLSNTPQTGSRAELVLEMRRGSARFSAAPPLLDALETTAVLLRHRTRPTGREIPLSLAADPEPNPRHAEPAPRRDASIA